VKSDTVPGQGTPGILRSHDFRCYLAGQTASGFGSSLSSVALAFGVLSLTRSASSLGLVLLASRAPVICLALIGGAVGDRWSRRRVMLATDGARTVLQAIAAGLLIGGHLDVWSLGALQAAAGMASAVYSPAADGLVANLAPAGQIGQANSLLGLSAGVAQISALGLAGVIVATVGPGVAFAIDSVTLAVSTISLAALRTFLPASASAGRSRLLFEWAKGGGRSEAVHGC
jgi:MFS family permease